MSPADYALGRQGVQINGRMALIHSGADKGFVGPVVVGLLNQGLIRLLPRWSIPPVRASRVKP